MGFHLDWKMYARLGANLAAAQTGHPEFASMETALEQAIELQQTPGTSIDARVDAYASLSIQVIEVIEGVKGHEIVDDANIQQLEAGVKQAIHALAAGLAAKKAAVPLASTTGE